MFLLMPTYYGLGKRCWDLETSWAVVEIPPRTPDHDIHCSFHITRPVSSPEWGLTYYKASITAQGLPEPSSLQGSTLGTRAAKHKGCNWGMQIDWWLQPRAVFGHTFSGIIWHMPQKESQFNCMTLSWWPCHKIVSVTFTFTSEIIENSDLFTTEMTYSFPSTEEKFSWTTSSSSKSSTETENNWLWLEGEQPCKLLITDLRMTASY